MSNDQFATRGRQFSISALRGTDPATGELVPDHKTQFKNASENLGRVLGSRGLPPDEVGRVTVLTPGAGAAR